MAQYIIKSIGSGTTAIPGQGDAWLTALTGDSDLQIVPRASGGAGAGWLTIQSAQAALRRCSRTKIKAVNHNRRQNLRVSHHKINTRTPQLPV